MKLHRVTLRNYKAYGDQEQHLDLRPLTLVFGKNNSGKSALVRLPRLVLGALEGKGGTGLPVVVRDLRFAQNFVDLVHGQDFFQRLSLGVQAEQADERLDMLATCYVPGLLERDAPSAIWSYDMKSPAALTLGPPAPRQQRPAFRGLLPTDGRWDTWRDAAGAALDAGIHIGPTRASVESVYSEGHASGMGPRGEEAPGILAQSSELADGAGDWFAAHMEGWRLSVKREGESFSLRISQGGALSTNLAQGGEGLQQVLPVVVHQLMRQGSQETGYLDIVEQPELHLHAAAQAPLADLFIGTARSARGTTIVETNSEPLLLRVQRRVAEGLDPAFIALYFVEMTPAGSVLHRINLNADGEVSWWPDGVFEEDFAEVAAMRRAQRQRRQPPADAGDA